MIVFTHDKSLIEFILMKSKCDIYKILNLSSYISGYEDVTKLITSISKINTTDMATNTFVDSREFDMMYASELENNPEMYYCLMNIVLHSYNGYCVIVLVSRDQYRDLVMESLIKYIQQKYGYNCWIVEHLDDILSIKDSGYSIEGMMAISRDINRLNELRSYGMLGPVMEPINIE